MAVQPTSKTRRSAVQQPPVAEGGRLGREVLGLCAIFCGLLVTLSLATFDSRDPWINHSLSNIVRIHNKAGEFGAYLSGSLFDLFGLGAWVAPVYFCIAGARRILGAQKWVWWRWTGFFLIALCVCMLGAASDIGAINVFQRGTSTTGAGGDISAHGGGLIGHMLFAGISGFMGSVGAMLIWLCILLLAFQMLTGISWKQFGAVTLLFLNKSAQELAARFLDFRNAVRQARIARAGRKAEEAFDLVAIEGLPPDKTPLQSHDTYVEGASSYALPEDIDTPTEAFLDKLEQLDREASSRTKKTAGGSKRAKDSLPLIRQQNGNGSFADDTPHYVAAEGSVEVHGAFHHDDAPAFAASSGQQPVPSRLRFEEEDANIPPWVSTIDGSTPADGSPVTGLPAMGSSRTGSGPRSFPPAEQAAGEDFLHALWREAGHEVTPVEYLEQLEPQLEREAPVLAPGAAPAGNATPSPRYTDVAVQPAAQAHPVAPATVAPPAAAKSVAGGHNGHSNGHSDGDTSEDTTPIPIFVAEEIAPAPEEPRKGFVGSVLNRMKRRIPMPSLELLQAASKSARSTPFSVLESKGKSLMTCLRDFNIQGELVGITPGPVVTMFEVRPAPGVRVSRIANLNDDLALALKAVAVRIQAPVPGTDTVGIEIPNEIRETVCLKELLGSQLFHNSKSLLTLALGKDIAGNPAVADLATMPHLLVAGATGAGKSVGINSIILSILYKARPHEVKMLLVDPKRVEMAIYADLPHLVHPVVTEMQLAKNALEWAVAEMEQRYDNIARAGVRNIADYNAKVASFGDNPPEGMEGLAFMPYLVIIIDELADLMLVAAKEVETSIVRLAQLARAAGIHLILATQRPSVDVVTGLIKANFPCRISFQVTSKHDSRTILDTVGAEHLLGKGDMLFKPGGGKFQRMHGAFVSDADVHAVVNYWKSQLKPEYQIDFADWGSEGTTQTLSGNGGGGGSDILSDPLYHEAVEFVRQQGKASISLIQRKFRIGFNKAARYVEQMEQDGIIGPADGSKPRLVIR